MAGADRERRPAALWALVLVLGFQAFSAIPPGLLLVVDPTGARMTMPLAMLRGTPFRDFLVPGLVLLFVLGLGAVLVAGCLLWPPAWPAAARVNPVKAQRWPWTAAVAYGIGLMTWIVVQVAMIGLGTWLQPLYFGVGLTIALVPWTPSIRRALAADGAGSG